MERWVAKVLCVFLTFFIPLFFTALPIKVHATFIKKGQAGMLLVLIRERSLFMAGCGGGARRYQGGNDLNARKY